jgi:Fe2+ transport system protein B
VSALGTVFAIEQKDANTLAAETEPLPSTPAAEDKPAVSLEDQLTEQLLKSYSVATALALLAWYIYAPQCLATFAVMRRETNSWKWPLFSFTYLLAAAYLAAWCTYRITICFLAA